MCVWTQAGGSQLQYIGSFTKNTDTQQQRMDAKVTVKALCPRKADSQSDKINLDPFDAQAYSKEIKPLANCKAY